jgi:hypothetical protein
MVPLFKPYDKNSVRYRWKVPEQKIGEFRLLAKLSENSNKITSTILPHFGFGNLKRKQQ